MPKIHGHYPTEIASPRPDGCLPISEKNVTSASEKPSRQFGLEPSGDRRDIGYARSGVEWLFFILRVWPNTISRVDNRWLDPVAATARPDCPQAQPSKQ